MVLRFCLFVLEGPPIPILFLAYFFDGRLPEGFLDSKVALSLIPPLADTAHSVLQLFQVVSEVVNGNIGRRRLSASARRFPTTIRTAGEIHLEEKSVHKIQTHVRDRYTYTIPYISKPVSFVACVSLDHLAITGVQNR